MKSTLKLSIATLAVVFGMVASASAASSTYYWKYFSTGGSIYPWYSNDNSWGYSNTSGSGFMEMVVGEDWGKNHLGSLFPEVLLVRTLHGIFLANPRRQFGRSY